MMINHAGYNNASTYLFKREFKSVEFFIFLAEQLM
ncbi:MAG: hypothetical protein K0S08_413 [Gammaproteobacteria bacterium]|jgi:hypothetical protein|nr:hypothetical protein [Gammaproteobacteria bacterium]